MIHRIFAHGFKGLDFDQPLERRSIFTGKVGSGKSSRSLAVALLVTGALPNTGIARTNAEMFNAVASGDTLSVGIETDEGKTLERIYKRGKKGSVSCSFRIDSEPVPKNLFELELDHEGICIADVTSFHALSDAKKIDELFRLFPPKGDVRGINADMAKTRERISRIDADIKAREQSSRNLARAIADMDLPAGTLPEIQAEIARLEREYQEARDEIVREKTRIEQKKNCAPIQQPATEKSLFEDAPVRDNRPDGAYPRRNADTRATASLEKVLSALERAGCDGCAARMVLRRELKNLQAEAVNG